MSNHSSRSLPALRSGLPPVSPCMRSLHAPERSSSQQPLQHKFLPWFQSPAKRQKLQKTNAFASRWDVCVESGAGVRVCHANTDAGRRVAAEVTVLARLEEVWAILTDYERLADFIPNLESCERLQCNKPGRVLLRQKGCSQAALWRLEAEAILEVWQQSLPMGARALHFKLVEGDFSEFEGRWVVERDPSVRQGTTATLLRYEARLVPKSTIPSTIVSHVVVSGLSANILAVAREAEKRAQKNLQPPRFATPFLEDDAPLPAPTTTPLAATATATGPLAGPMPAKGPAWDDSSPLALADTLTNKTRSTLPRAQARSEQQRQSAGVASATGQIGSSNNDSNAVGAFDSIELGMQSSVYADEQEAASSAAAESTGLGGREPSIRPLYLDAAARSSGVTSTSGRLPFTARPWVSRRVLDTEYLGLTSVPLPPAAPSPRALTDSMDAGSEGSYDEADAMQATYPAFELGPGDTASTAAAAEVHLRRLDCDNILHTRTVAVINIEATAEEVWQVLTDYERLPDFVPNLALSQRLERPAGASDRLVLLRQVGYKRMLYMSLHAESVISLVEKPCKEIQFKQISGDFELLQGKWLLQEVPAKNRVNPSQPLTQLKYALETRLPRTTRLLGFLEPLLERVVYEDIPANLNSVKQRVEFVRRASVVQARVAAVEAAEGLEAAEKLQRKLARPRLSAMTDDFEVLRAELQQLYGQEAVLPGRTAMTEAGRTDVYLAIVAHGGPVEVAERLGWVLSWKPKRPRGYWDNTANIRMEMMDFIAEHQLPPGVMPKKMALRRAGRADLEKVVERMGGQAKLAELLGFAMPCLTRQQAWDALLADLQMLSGLQAGELYELACEVHERAMWMYSDHMAASSGQSRVTSNRMVPDTVLEDVLALRAASAIGDQQYPDASQLRRLQQLLVIIEEAAEEGLPGPQRVLGTLLDQQLLTNADISTTAVAGARGSTISDGLDAERGTLAAASSMDAPAAAVAADKLKGQATEEAAALVEQRAAALAQMQRELQGARPIRKTGSKPLSSDYQLEELADEYMEVQLERFVQLSLDTAASKGYRSSKSADYVGGGSLVDIQRGGRRGPLVQPTNALAASRVAEDAGVSRRPSVRPSGKRLPLARRQLPPNYVVSEGGVYLVDSSDAEVDAAAWAEAASKTRMTMLPGMRREIDAW